MAKKEPDKSTGKKAAHSASEVLNDKGTKKDAKSAAGSALSQKKKGGKK
jgi:hypothetical protein